MFAVSDGIKKAHSATNPDLIDGRFVITSECISDRSSGVRRIDNVAINAATYNKPHEDDRALKNRSTTCPRLDGDSHIYIDICVLSDMTSSHSYSLPTQVPCTFGHSTCSTCDGIQERNASVPNMKTNQQ